MAKLSKLILDFDEGVGGRRVALLRGFYGLFPDEIYPKEFFKSTISFDIFLMIQ